MIIDKGIDKEGLGMDFTQLVRNMESRGIEARAFASRRELEEALAQEIREAGAIGFGGSMTLMQLGLYETFRSMGKQVYWHWKAGPTERMEVLRKAAQADVYFCSGNAVTEDGRIVNIDGNGNRISAMIFGIPKVILIVGRNKVCKDLDAAMERIKREACPPNARRLKLNTPCIAKDCPDCRSADRMCNITMILEGCPNMTRMIVCFLDEDLGY